MQLIRQKLKAYSLFLIWLFFSASIFAALNKTYPTSAVTGIRMDTYVDAMSTIYNSTETYVYRMDNSTFGNKIEYSTSTMMDMKVHFINLILNSDVEQYLVYPATDTTNLIGDWKGWCAMVVNGNLVPINCPPKN